LKILICSGIFPPDIGGPASYVPKIASYLSNRGHVVEVICLSDVIKVDEDEKYNYKITRISRHLFLPIRILKTILSIFFLARKSDLIFANTLATESWIGSFLSRKKIIHKVVGDYAWEKAVSLGWTKSSISDFKNEKSLRLKLLKWYCYVPFHYAEKIIVPSNFTKNNVLNWGLPLSNIEVIYNGIKKTNLKIEKEKDSIIAVGRLISLKRIDTIINSVVGFPNKKLYIVGDGPERKKLERLAKDSNLTNRVFFLGTLSNENTITKIAECEVFVLNSTGENFPHVILEAMIGDTFVITNDVGGCKEAIQDGVGGYLLDSNEKTIEKGILFFDEQKEQVSKMNFNALKIVVTQFNEKKMLENTEKELLSHI